MVVVTIIGLGTAMSAAGVGDTFSDMRAMRAARELVRLGRRAVSESSQYMRAYMVWVQPTLDRVSLIRGTGWSCTNENWDAQFTAAPGLCGAAASPCIEQVVFPPDDSFGPQIDFDGVGGPVATDTAFCYAPNGEMFSAQPGGGLVGIGAVLNNANVGLGGFRFAVRRMAGTEQRGVTRYVLFPQGGAPRVMR